MNQAIESKSSENTQSIYMMNRFNSSFNSYINAHTYSTLNMVNRTSTVFASQVIFIYG